MAEKRRGLGKGISALIPTMESQARPSDIFFDSSPAEAPGEAPSPLTSDGEQGSAGSAVRAPARTRSTAGSRKKTVAKRVAQEGGTTVPASDEGTSPHDAGNVTQVTRHGASSAIPADDTGLRPIPGVRAAEIAVDDIVRNRANPRQVFDEEELAELAASIGEVGLLQPVVVRPAPAGSEKPYELIMGERRLRAVSIAGLETIPAIIRETDDTDMLRDALLENLHRAQLNPLEEASAYQQLLEDFSCTHDELARRIARSRPQISNTLRLLKLPPLVQRRVAAGVLSAGHARALLGLSDGAAMERLAQRIVAEGLSVRSTEEIVAMGVPDETDDAARPRPPRQHPMQGELNVVAHRLADRLDTRVKVTMGARKGRITVDFATMEDLERILTVLEPSGPRPESA